MGDNAIGELTPVSFDSLTEVRYQAAVCLFLGTDLEALLLAFSGEVGYGSEGSNDTAFMACVTGQFVALVLSDCVVFDLRELRYDYGDGMLALPYSVHMEYPGMPCIFLVSAKCRGSLESLFGVDLSDPASDMFEDFEDCMRRARTRALEFTDADARNEEMPRTWKRAVNES